MTYKCPSALLKSSNLTLYLTSMMPFAFKVASSLAADFRTEGPSVW
jgi:hypothetical protein